MRFNPSRLIISLFFIFLISCSSDKQAVKIKVFHKDNSRRINFALTKLSEAASVEIVNSDSTADLIIISDPELSVKYGVQENLESVVEEGYSIKRIFGGKIAILANDQSGAMYGILDAAEQIEMGKDLNTMQEREITPAVLFRAIKFNLPWDSYRVHESLQLHSETVRDTMFWQSFLDMMVENRLNVLTLWNMHPFTYMIRAKNFPEACPFTDEELKDWQNFWHTLFGMAGERGIKTFMINWNIFVTPEFAQKYGVADYCLPDSIGANYYGPGDYSPIIQRYTRESMTQLINEYPELTGFGVSQNERMQGVDDQVWQDWIVDTYFDAMDKADRKIEFIMRAHTHPAPELTRKAIEDNAYRLGTIWVPVKFNWSHAHATPKLMFIHGGSRSKSLWEPAPKNYKMVFTMRNEDFFILRWGEPDFVRNVLEDNNQDYVGGFMIGSETYIPAKEYITKPGPHLTWKYAFEKQWLFYQVWGRLMYDKNTSDEIFAHSFNKKYNINFGDKLVEAHKLSDKMPLKLASYYCASWDFTLYSEGFLAGYRSNMGSYYDEVSPFISVDEIIGAITLDTSLVSVKDYVAGNYRGSDKITPLQMADGLEKDSKKALEIVSQLETDDPALKHEISDIITWSYLGLYFSEKLRGSTELQYFRVNGSEENQDKSIKHLEKALTYWEKVVDQNKPYLDEIPLLHLGDRFNNGGNKKNKEKFSWANFTDEVKYDIKIAEDAVQGESYDRKNKEAND